MSANPIFTEESIAENKKLGNMKSSIFTLGGKLNYDVNTQIVARAIGGMCKPINPQYKQRSRRGD